MCPKADIKRFDEISSVFAEIGAINRNRAVIYDDANSADLIRWFQGLGNVEIKE